MNILEAIRIKPTRKVKAEETQRHQHEIRRRQEEETRAKEVAQYTKRVREHNLDLMTSIIANCPSGHAVFVKFACGNWPENWIRQEAQKLLDSVNEGADWGYLQGAGLGCINPKHERYNCNPKLILDALTLEPNPWLEGTQIIRWHYVPLG